MTTPLEYAPFHAYPDGATSRINKTTKTTLPTRTREEVSEEDLEVEALVREAGEMLEAATTMAVMVIR